MACDLLRHEPESFKQDTENELFSSENIIINMNEDTAMMSDVTSDVGGIPDASDNRGSTSFFCSGKLFTFVTKVTVLWNVRHKGYASLCALFVLLNIASVAAEIITNTTRRHQPLNPNVTKNISSFVDAADIQALLKLNEVYNVMVCCSGFASTLTLILLIFSLHKLSKKMPTFSLSAAQTRVSSKEWLLINIVVSVCAVLFVVTVVLTEYSLMSGIGDDFFQNEGFLVTSYLGQVINLTTSFICIYVFAVVSCALGHFVSTCFEDIKSMADGNLSDIITIHQLLRQRLIIASSCFKVWFVVHWIMYGAICLSIIVVNTLNLSVLHDFELVVSIIEFEVFFGMNAVFFVVPCVYASRITWQCNELPFKINCARLEDWSENHPFRDRATLNEFIFYAERSQSGFRLGNYTFGSTGTWVSVFVSLIGLVFKIMGGTLWQS